MFSVRTTNSIFQSRTNMENGIELTHHDGNSHVFYVGNLHTHLCIGLYGYKFIDHRYVYIEILVKKDE